jgi:nitroreductase
MGNKLDIDSSDMSFFELVGNVRAIRRLKSDPVPMELMWKVLNAGVQAASGQNTQPWKFVVISDPERKKWFADRYAAAFESRFGLRVNPEERGEYKQTGQLGALYYQMDHLHEAPYLLLVCGERDWPFKVPSEERVGLAPPNYGAVYPCVQNILLACRSVGLGAALTTMHQVFEDELHEYFDIPNDFGVVVSIPIGYPQGRFGPVSRIPAEEKTFLDVWGNVLPTGPETK